jgi:maleylpyruvate isomerase
VSVKLYGYWRSSATWRVRLGLVWKKLPYEVVPVNISPQASEQWGQDHLARNPTGQVPVLEVVEEDGQTVRLTQSLAILEYLDERWPTPALLPHDRLGRAHARRLAENVNAGIQPLQNLSVLRKVKTELGHDSDAWARHFIRKGLEALEAEAQGVGGRFMVGDAFSIADVCLLPQLYNARRFGASLEGLDTLLRVEAACEALPGLAAAHPDRQIDAPKE